MRPVSAEYGGTPFVGDYGHTYSGAISCGTSAWLAAIEQGAARSRLPTQALTGPGNWSVGPVTVRTPSHETITTASDLRANSIPRPSCALRDGASTSCGPCSEITPATNPDHHAPLDNLTETHSDASAGPNCAGPIAQPGVAVEEGIILTGPRGFDAVVGVMPSPVGCWGAGRFERAGMSDVRPGR